MTIASLIGPTRPLTMLTSPNVSKGPGMSIAVWNRPPRGLIRRRSAIPVLVAAALAGTTLGTAGASAQATTAHQPIQAAVSTAAQAQSDPRVIAQAKAKSTGKPAPVDALTTPYSTTTANPDGTLTYTDAPTPRQVKKDGVWTPVDATLVPVAGGGYAPRAAVGGLRLSGGGTGAFASIGESSWSVAYTFPTALPKPMVSGDTATYPDALPGVDLVVTATVDGSFEDTLVVRDRAAAANPTLAHLRLGVAVHGATLHSDAAGNLVATDAHGATVMTSGTPQMWDSSRPASDASHHAVSAPRWKSDAHTAGDGAKSARLARTDSVAAGSSSGIEELDPDPALLASPTATFPLYLDPWSVDGGSGNHTYTQLTSGDPYNGTKYWTTLANGDGEGVGKANGVSPTGGDDCNNQACGIDRTVINYGMPSFPAGENASVRVESASAETAVHFVANDTGNGNTANVWSMHGATSSSDWANPPAYDNSVNAHSVGSPAGSLSFTTPKGTYFPQKKIFVDITGSAQLAVNSGYRSWTLMWTGAETSEYSFWRMDVTATAIYMTYSYIPNAPSNLHTTPAAAGGTTDACGTGVDNGFIGGASSITSASTGGVTFYATPSTNTPAARVAAYFTVFDHTTNSNALTTYTGVGLGSSGVQQSVGLNMTAGHTYTWHAVTGDDSAGYSTGQLWSGSSASCTFTYDPAPPTLVTVTSKDFPANGGGKTVGSGGTLTLSATDTVSGIDHFDVTIDGGSASRVAPASSSGGTATAGVSFTPTQWGSHTLTYDAVDRAGNVAAAPAYVFYVADNPNHNATVGNLTGENTPQWAAVDSSGALRAYSPADPAASTGVVISAANQAPDGTSWAHSLITHRGSTTGNKSDDLFAWTPSKPNALYTYINAPLGTFTAGKNQSPDGRPNCSANSSLPCYQSGGRTTVGANNYAPDWRNVRAMTALGAFPAADANLSYYAVGSTVGASDLLTAESDGAGKANLWLYPSQNPGYSLGVPFLLSKGGPSPVPTGASASWTDYDLLCPGDLNGDGIQDLWLRDRTTGTLYQALITVTGTSPNLAPQLGSLTAVAGAPSFSVANYPQITTDGDLDGAGKPSLVAFKTSGTPVVYTGAALTTSTTTTGGFTAIGQAESSLDPIRPVAGLSVAPTSQGSLTVTANASASRAGTAALSSYTFDFGDHSPVTTVTAPATAANHTYAAGGTYTVAVTVTDASGVTSTLSTTLNVNATNPIAQLSVPTSLTIGTPFTADASGSTAGFGTITKYSFDFGDGTVLTSATPTATHTYTDPTLVGSITVTVTVTDSNNLTNQASQMPTLNPAETAPAAALAVAPAGPVGVGVPVTADASASTPGQNDTIASYSFAFGDGTTVSGTAPTATHAYSATGTYTVVVTVTGASGLTSTATGSVTVTTAPPTAALALSNTTTATGLTVTADASASAAGTNPISTYAFDFGDGTTVAASSAKTATHVYTTAGTFTVKTTVTDSSGLTGTATATVTVRTPPTPALTLTPTGGTVPLAVTADASGSTAGSAAITGYTFSFGDGSAAIGPQAGATAAHTFTSAGTYTVLVTATDANGFSSSTSTAITVAPRVPPTAAVTASPSVTTIGAPVTVDASASAAGTAPIASYKFDFGDGSAPVTGTSTSATHAYSAAGGYTVTVTATGTDGLASSATSTVRVAYGLWPQSATPATADLGDGGSVELGVKFTADQPTTVVGVTFYKAAANTGTHTGSLWTANGTLVATGTFTGETATGWQSMLFNQPVSIVAGRTYIVSYHAPAGHYSWDPGMFAAPLTVGHITAPQSTSTSANGVYVYSTAFPSQPSSGGSYGVGPLVLDGADTSGPTVGVTTPSTSATGVAVTTAPTIVFDRQIDPATLTVTAADNTGTAVPGTVTYAAANQTATFTPRGQWAASTTYTLTVNASDLPGNPMAAPAAFSFSTGTTMPTATCPCTLWPTGTAPAQPDITDNNAAELGTTFIPAVNGHVTGVMFYKGTGNTGTHIGNLWSSSGTLLATGTFTGETANGWQTLSFTTPVAVTAGTTYIASYYAPNGNYAGDTGYFTTPQRSYPLTAPAGTPTQGNGVFKYGPSSSFPSSNGNEVNYYVSPVFTTS